MSDRFHHGNGVWSRLAGGSCHLRIGGTVPQQPTRQNSQKAHGQRKNYAIYSHILIIGGNYSETLTFYIHPWFELW
jgi:hypothetical protein